MTTFVNKLISATNTYLSDDKLWFASTPETDQIIINLFKDISEEEVSKITYNAHDYGLIFSLVIYYDQINRHLHRSNPDLIAHFDNKAINLTQFCLDNQFDINYYSALERCFLLMPLRHTFNNNNIKFVIDKINSYKLTDNSGIYNRFLKASLLSYYDLLPLIPFTVSSEDINLDKIKSVLDTSTSTFILNRIPDQINIVANTKYIYNPKITKQYDQYINDIKYVLSNNNKIAISLSCGVDSMVLAYILASLRQVYHYELIAIHINYNNREEENKLETDWIALWCQYMNIPLYIRSIDLIKRTRDSDRMLYEDVTREIRFQTYKKFDIPVFLGHNLDDCLENIFSNIKKQQSYTNLRGMNADTIDHNVHIIRPFLNLSKSDIIAFAREHNLLHLKTSTPAWSERGKTRDKLIPSINEFHPDIIPGLIAMADYYKSVHDTYDITIDTFMNKITNNQVIIDKELDYGLHFWKPVIIKWLISNQAQIPSNKSIESCLVRFNRRLTGNIVLNAKAKFNLLLDHGKYTLTLLIS